MPGQHEVALAVPVLEPLVVAQRQRPRADEAHLAAQHVPELRQLVEREPAQDARRRVVTRGSSRILNSGPSASFARLELGLPLGRARDHRAELEHPELALAEPDAPVAVEAPGRAS